MCPYDIGANMAHLIAKALLTITSSSLDALKAVKLKTFSVSNHNTTVSVIHIIMTPGPRLNIKTVLSTYGDFHVKDKTAVRTSYL